MHKRLLTILATITLSTALLVGCGNKQEEIPQATTETATATTTEESITEQAEEATATLEKTAEPTPEVKEEPSEETTTEPETEPTEIAEPEPTEEPTPESEPQAIYTFTDMSATMYAQQTVNVRDLPDTNGDKIGSLSTNDEITISAKCNETGWYRFEYNGSVAYVSNKYVGENKFEIQQAPTDNGTEQMQAPANSGTPEWTSGVLRENYGQYEDGTYWTYTCGVGAPTSTYWTNVCNIIDYEYVGKYNVNVYHLFNGEYRYSYLTDREIYKVHCGNINCIYAMDN